MPAKHAAIAQFGAVHNQYREHLAKKLSLIQTLLAQLKLRGSQHSLLPALEKLFFSQLPVIMGGELLPDKVL